MLGLTAILNARGGYPGNTGDFAPINLTAPVVTPSTAGGADILLTTTNGSWVGSPAPTYTYQWTRDGADIVGETANTYTTVLADVDTIVCCEVTATNIVGAVMAQSNGIAVGATGTDMFLLEDGTSFFLMEDGISFFLLEG